MDRKDAVAEKYQSSKSIRVVLTEGQLEWLLDMPEYRQAVSDSKSTNGPMYGTLNEIIDQFRRQAGR